MPPQLPWYSYCNCKEKIKAVYPEGDIEDQMNHMITRLPCEVQTAIKTSSRGVTDIFEFISICEEVINNIWGKINSQTRRYIHRKVKWRISPVRGPLRKRSQLLSPCMVAQMTINQRTRKLVTSAKVHGQRTISARGSRSTWLREMETNHPQTLNQSL